jgi:hypothetical protein
MEEIGKGLAAEAPAEEQPPGATVSRPIEAVGDIFHAAAAGELLEDGVLERFACLHQRQ